MTLLNKIHREVGTALRNGKFEESPGGLYLHAAKLVIGGTMSYRIDGGPRVLGDNTATFEGLTDILSVYFKQTAQRTAFYFVPYTANVAPDQTLTAASFNGTMSEFLAYTAAARVAWVPGAIAAQSLDNSATAAQLVLNAGGTIRGAALSTTSAKSATTGVLPVCAAFDAAAVLTSGSKLNLEYVISAQDV